MLKGLAGLLIWGIPVKAVAVGASMTVAFTALVVVSGGVLTDPDIVEELAFDAGGIDLTVFPGSTLVTMTTPDMTPGDSFTAPFTVGNAGKVELRYTMVSTTTEDVLASELLLTIRSDVADCDGDGWDQSGVELYRGPLGTAAASPILGSAAQGPQPGDRLVPGGVEEQLCFNVALPLGAGNLAQNITSTATFTFIAEQNVNPGAELRRAD